MTRATEGRNGRLDGLRAVAFLLVFLHHALRLPLGWIGVDLFFVLSGYLITDILERQRHGQAVYRSFYARRALRILPPYYLVLAAVAFWGQARPWEDWVPYLLFINNVTESFGDAGILGLGPTWSLAVEWQFYLIWPLVVVGCRPRRLRQLCWGLVLLAPLVRLGLTLELESFWPVYHLLPARMDLLAAGGLLAMTGREHPVHLRRFSDNGLWVALSSGALFVLLAAVLPDFRTSANALVFNTIGYSLIVVGSAGVIAHTLVPRTGLPASGLSHPVVRYLGLISYTMYLVHRPVLLALAELPRGGRAIAGLVVTVALASASWFLLEKPLQQWKRRAVPYEGA